MGIIFIISTEYKGFEDGIKANEEYIWKLIFELLFFERGYLS